MSRPFFPTLAAVAIVSLSTAAQGADTEIAAPEPPLLPVAEPFDWDGFYAGVRFGAQREPGVSDANWFLGVHAGVNTTFDFFLVGAELTLDGVFDTAGTHAYGGILARAGVLLSGEALAYGVAGFGSDFGAPSGPGSHVLAGAGLEFALTDDMSLRGQYVYGWDGGAAQTDIHRFSLGASFHF